MLATIMVTVIQTCYGQKAMNLDRGNCLVYFSKYYGYSVDEFKLVFTNDSILTFKVQEWNHSKSSMDDNYSSYYYPTKEEMKYCQEHQLRDVVSVIDDKSYSMELKDLEKLEQDIQKWDINKEADYYAIKYPSDKVNGVCTDFDTYISDDGLLRIGVLVKNSDAPYKIKLICDKDSYDARFKTTSTDGNLIKGNFWVPIDWFAGKEVVEIMVWSSKNAVKITDEVASRALNTINSAIHKGSAEIRKKENLKNEIAEKQSDSDAILKKVGDYRYVDNDYIILMKENGQIKVDPEESPFLYTTATMYKSEEARIGLTAKKSGKDWGIVDSNNEWIIEPKLNTREFLAGIKQDRIMIWNEKAMNKKKVSKDVLPRLLKDAQVCEYIDEKGIHGILNKDGESIMMSEEFRIKRVGRNFICAEGLKGETKEALLDFNGNVLFGANNFYLFSTGKYTAMTDVKEFSEEAGTEVDVNLFTVLDDDMKEIFSISLPQGHYLHYLGARDNFEYYSDFVSSDVPEKPIEVKIR